MYGEKAARYPRLSSVERSAGRVETEVETVVSRVRTRLQSLSWSLNDEPFQVEVRRTMHHGVDRDLSAHVEISDGKLCVVEYVSAYISLRAGQRVARHFFVPTRTTSEVVR